MFGIEKAVEKLGEVLKTFISSLHDNQERLFTSVESLAGEVNRLSLRVQELTNLMGRQVFPAEEMRLLTGELRAIRYEIELIHPEAKRAIGTERPVARDASQGKG